MRRSVLFARQLHPQSVLETVSADPGMTALYYANRYFGGKESVMPLNHILWQQLKRAGRVSIERTDGPDAPPRWYPVVVSPRVHVVHRHCAEDEDLSVLHAADPAAASAPSSSAESTAETENGKEASASSEFELESAIVRLVQQVPGKDIHFYVNELPLAMQKRAPAAFKRLRESELLERTTTPSGTYVWS